jgi:hypothetical protein
MAITKQQFAGNHAAFITLGGPVVRNFVHDYNVKTLPLMHYMQNATGPADLATMSTGGTATEINSAEWGGVKLATTKAIGTYIPVPLDIDGDKAIDLRWLAYSSDAAGTITHTTLYDHVEIASDTIAVASTAMDTVGTAITLATAHLSLGSNWEQIAAASAAALDLNPPDSFLNVKTTVALVTATVYVITGVQLGYYRKSIA